MKKLLLLAFVFGLTVNLAVAQEAAEEEPKEGWEIGAGLGLDFAQLLQINPKVGAGQNRIGLAGALNFFGNYTKNRTSWDNAATWQFGVQKFGSGSISGSPDQKVPFEKAIDEFRLRSKFGFKTSEDSKFFYAANVNFNTQITPSHRDVTGALTGLYLEDVRGGIDTLPSSLQSEFLSPANLTLSLGLDYKPTSFLSVFYSPVAYKGIFVLNDELASLVAQTDDRGLATATVHGNEVEIVNGEEVFKNSFNQFGSNLVIGYAKKYFKDKLVVTSTLNLYSNYLNKPENIDVDWQNQFDYMIFEGLSLSVLANLFYDHDVFVQITNFDRPGGVEENLGRRLNFTQQLLIKYTVTF